MEVSKPLLIALFACLLATGGFVINWLISRKQFRNLRIELEAHKSLIQQLTKAQQNFYNTIEECQARSMAVASSVTSLEDDIAALAKQIKSVSEQDPDSRLYQRAAEMLQAGASMDEVMHSCDLPAAEVQLLMNIHKPA
ncbi:MAG: DUF2802 domain-containing protein [Aestuariibacter sp.]|nr:DUF2802 domain-containing protein [Aestuariibacter sp.]MCP4277976.1 DUF2802 domain-containing protein [Gammaproteobacteria bacterium]MCP4527162.1 DUF2802 domain-containing protein [Aestuariibacter sp.]MCP4948576.1 DUF2802 domain-containing protein [Aestuariibacter sp.]